jgi:hypothetical protein
VRTKFDIYVLLQEIMFEYTMYLLLELEKKVICPSVDTANVWKYKVRVMEINGTFNNIWFISWRENHRSSASHWQTLSHNAVLSTPGHEQGSNSLL